MYTIPKDINLDNYPSVKAMLEKLDSLLEDKEEEIGTIDFESNGSKEDEFYAQMGLKTELNSDYSMSFVNYGSGGLPPSSWEWTTLYMSDVEESALKRLEYFLENKIFKPFRMRTWLGERPKREHFDYSIKCK